MIDEQGLPGDARAALAALCQSHGEDFASLSRLVGRNPAYIQQYVRRGTPRVLPERERRILARHFEVSERLLGGEGEDATLTIRSLEAAGETGLSFSRAWLDRLTATGADQLALVRAAGDSMAPTLADGDDLLVDCSDAAERLRDGIYLLDREGERTVKRVTLHPLRPRATLQSDNPAHADWPDIALDALVIVGRVIWAGRRIA